MGLEVIGAGFGRTGTFSLKLALEKLGFAACYHMYEVAQHPEHVKVWQQAIRGEEVNWEALYRGYRASVDWPSCSFWEIQLRRFPDARVILTEREPNSWYDSVMSSIYPASLRGRELRQFGVAQAWVDMTFALVWDGTFHGQIEDRQHAIDVYLAHNDYVKKHAPRDRLLVFEAAQGWEPLCQFLGSSVPDEPYPHTNMRPAQRPQRAARGA